MRHRLVALLAIALLAGAPAIGQEGFEGLATVGRFGRFPSGLYGASSLVAPNSVVQIRNLETGINERIIITEGVSEPGVFLVLSPEAAGLLGITTSGVTRVRLIESAVSGFRAPGLDAEQPFSADPEVNPRVAGRSLLDSLPPPPGASAAPAASTVVEAAPSVSDAPAVDLEPTDTIEMAVDEPAFLNGSLARPGDPELTGLAPVVDEPVPVAEPSVADAPEAIAVVPAPALPDAVAPRSGIASGVARSGVGRVQEDFERPEATLPAARRAPVAETAFEPTLPEVAAVQSREPADPTPAGDESPERSPEPLVDVPESVDDGPGIVDVAIRSVSDRLPRKDLFPTPAGDDRENGLLVTPRPDQPDVVAVLPDATAPALERPAMAGIGPLRAAPEELVVDLAVASAPRTETPDPFGAVRLVESEPVFGPLADARLAADELPGTDTLARSRPAAGEPEVVLTAPVERPVEATPAEPEASLVETPVETPSDVVDEQPSVSGLGRIEAADTALSDVEPAVARVAAPERPDTSPFREPDPREEIPSVVAAPRPIDVAETDAEAVVRAEEPVTRPEAVPEDAILSLEPADFRPPEVPAPERESLIAREQPRSERDPDVVVTEAPLPADDIEPVVEVVAEPVVEAETEAPVAVTPEPPKVEPVAEAPAPVAVVEAATVAGAVATSRAVDDAFYLQIGAYSNASTADVAVNAIGAAYPMAVLPASADGRTVYRVLVGPLERDETGMLLLLLRSKGYRDTFIRSGSDL